MPTVKRPYDSSARRARAERVRETLLDTARDLLVRDGYAATTIPQLAHACGVSAESIYKRFPGKPALVRAVVARALEGSGPVPAETRSDALPAEDLETLLRGWARLTGEVAPRVAPILLLVHAAAGHDRALAELDRELDDNRRTRMAANASRLAAAGHLPATLSTDVATDILWTYSAPQLYDLLVQRCAWDLEQYAQFVADGLVAHFTA